MPFHPDIVVTEPGSFHTLLIVEVKAGTITPDSEYQLRRYMLKMNCPTGLIVSPREIFIYRNLFNGYSDDSVQKVGAFAAPSKWSAYTSRGSEIDFEDRVQRWLEDMREERPTDMLHEAANALEELVMPSLLQGNIHAAGPRISI